MARLNRQTKKMVLILAAAGAILAAVMLAAAWQLGWFAPVSSPLQVGQPGAAAGSADRYQIEADNVDHLRQRILKLLEVNPGGFASWYRLAGKYGQPEAVRSTEFLAADQLRYGQYLMEQGDRQAFQNWWRSFRTLYLSGSGLVRATAASTDDNIRTADNFWRTNLAAARLLAQSCSAWPDRQRRADLDNMSAQLLTLADQALAADYAAAVPTPGPTPDPAATPTPKPVSTPAAAAEPRLNVLRLASLDLFAMQQLARLDARWQTLYERCLLIVQNGYLGDAMPLYALAYSEEQGGYVYFSGDSPAIDTEEALLALLHLCESGQDITRSLSWLRDQMYNQHALYISYHIAQGQPTSSEECLIGYAIIARIARILSDEDLYRSAADRLIWHQATNQRSEALDAIFREDSSGLILVTAADNTWALIALQ